MKILPITKCNTELGQVIKLTLKLGIKFLKEIIKK